MTGKGFPSTTYFVKSTSPLSAHLEVLRQVPFLPGSWNCNSVWSVQWMWSSFPFLSFTWQASSHRSRVLYLTLLSFELRKHCSIPYLRQILPLQSPCWHTWTFLYCHYQARRLRVFNNTWVPPLHSVTLSSLVSAFGHKAVLPLQ